MSENLPKYGQRLSLGQRIRAKRKQLGWSQQRLAVFLGVTWGTVQRWEKDRGMIQNTNNINVKMFLEVNLRRIKQVGTIVDL